MVWNLGSGAHSCGHVCTACLSCHHVKVCYKETRWVGMRKQAGNHQRHTRTINASPRTQANNAAQATNSNPPTTPLHKHLTRTPHTHHTTPCVTKAPATDTAARHPPRAQQGPVQPTHTHTQLKSRRRGSPPAPGITPRHRSAGAMGRNKQNTTNKI